MFNDLPMIMDGATGTRLQALGMPAGACTEDWIIKNPDKLIEVQKGYIEAGSEMLYAPTFGAHRVNFQKHGIERSVESMVGELVELSRHAAGGKALVAGDLSSTGLLVEPYGDTEPEELFEVFREQAAALEKAGVDLFGIETQMYLDEAAIAARAVRSVSDKPIICSFSCGPTGKSLWGEDLADVCEGLGEFELSAFGVNCCGDMELLCTVLEGIRRVTDLPLIAKPNAGLPKTLDDGTMAYDMDPEELAKYAVKFVECGAGLIGGCCGTDGRHIAAIARALKK